MSTEAKVGAFVMACLALLGVTVYYVGNFGKGRVTPYRTYLRYAGGVATGSEVLFGGISAGRVASVHAWEVDPTQIEILLEVKEGTPVNENSVARLGTVSLMSSPAIAITTGSKEAPRLPAGRAIRSEETVSIDEMARKLSTIADNAQGLITQVQGELSQVSGSARTLLANLNTMTGTANQRQIAQLLQQANTLVQTQAPKLDRLTDQILQVSQRADGVVAKIGPLVDHADGAIGNVNTTIDQLRDPLRQELAQLQATTEQARSLITAIQGVVRANDQNLGMTVENLRAATENLNQLAGEVKQRPWSLVRIRQPEDRKVPGGK